MKWNWQQDDWPLFTYDLGAIKGAEEQLYHHSGLLFGAFKHLGENDKSRLKVEIISNEALKTSEIEGEHLDLDSLQSSVQRQLGLQFDHRKTPSAEDGVAEMMVNLYHTYDAKLEHRTMYDWHAMLMKGRTYLKDVGKYRTGEAPMRILSGPIHAPKIHFEAPPSSAVTAEMDQFVSWFNNCGPTSTQSLPAIVRAGIAHLYFVSIHPFEDGNGRVGRAIAEKALAQSLRQPTLIALAAVIEKNRSTYYAGLAKASRSNELTEWLIYFSSVIFDAQRYTQSCIDFLIAKAKMSERLKTRLNARQEKVLTHLFEAGPGGFEGGLSAENYIRISKTSRPTATRDLQDLVAKGALTRQGERKHTRYFLNIT